MTSLTPDDIVFARDQRQTIALSLVGLVVLVYDYLLTLDSEIKYIWVRQHKRGSAWYLSIRYFTLFSNIAMAFLVFENLEAEELAVGITLIMRVYAMYSFDKRILSFFVIATLATVGVGAWSVIPSGPTPVVNDNVTLPVCHVPQSKTEATRKAVAWGAELACDTIVFALTMFRAIPQTRNTLTVPHSLWHVMMRDGESIQTIKAPANFLAKARCTSGQNDLPRQPSKHPYVERPSTRILPACMADFCGLTSSSVIGTLAPPTATISVVMICRVMLNLHETAAIENDEDAAATHPEPLQFARSIGTDPQEMSVF
ncbi:hypothetical protein C8J57DRAFT_1514093 [Mycena rebaudengoi]|nr:hypothetical protein C8J57DRAFT_1514093 [Mycena rebaudengoi]